MTPKIVRRSQTAESTQRETSDTKIAVKIEQYTRIIEFDGYGQGRKVADQNNKLYGRVVFDDKEKKNVPHIGRASRIYAENDIVKTYHDADDYGEIVQGPT